MAPNASSRKRTAVFADLRKRNEYRSRIARMLEAKRQRHLDGTNPDQRKHRVHQAR
jgi:hypothetical protein